MMRHRIITALSILSSSAAFLPACQEKENVIVTPGETSTKRESGSRVVFSLLDNYTNGTDTRTEYSHETFKVGSSNKERIDWVAGDPIYVWCSDGNAGTFTVKAGEKDSNISWTAVSSGTSALTWGKAGEYSFYATYPQSPQASLDVSEQTKVLSATINAPAYNSTKGTYTYTNAGTGKSYAATVFKPTDEYMRSAVMTAAKKTSTSESGPVTLSFHPAMSAFEFRLQNAYTSGSMKVKSVTLTSSEPLTGSFTASVKDPSSEGEIDPGTVSVSSGEKTITYEFNTEVAPKEYLVFTAIALPLDRDLTIKVTTDDGGTLNSRSLRLYKTSEGPDSKPFLACHKYNIDLGISEKKKTLSLTQKEVIFFTIWEFRSKIFGNGANADVLLKNKELPETPFIFDGDEKPVSEKTNAQDNKYQYLDFWQQVFNAYEALDDSRKEDCLNKIFTELIEDTELEKILDYIANLKSVTLKFGGEGLYFNLGKEEMSLFKSLETLNFTVTRNSEVEISIEDMTSLNRAELDHGVTFSFIKCPELSTIRITAPADGGFPEYTVLVDNCPKITNINSSTFFINSPDKANVTFRNMTIDAINIDAPKNLTIENCTFKDNKITSGSLVLNNIDRCNLTIKDIKELSSADIQKGNDGPKTLSIENCPKFKTLNLYDLAEKTTLAVLKDLPLFEGGTVTKGQNSKDFTLTIENCSNSVDAAATLTVKGKSNVSLTKTDSPKLTVVDESGSEIK